MYMNKTVNSIVRLQEKKAYRQKHGYNKNINQKSGKPLLYHKSFPILDIKTKMMFKQVSDLCLHIQHT